MIRKLSGIIVDNSEGILVVEVNGIGYLVNTTITTNTKIHDQIELWTHLAVRETSLDLYGFCHRQECDVFEYLLTIPKIGPKSALQILNKASIPLLIQCAYEQDAGRLAKHSGIGKKTAEKIVLGLKDSPLLEQYQTTSENVSTEANDDTVATLIALGYSERDAYTAVKDLLHTNPELSDQPQKLITAALRILSTH